MIFSTPTKSDFISEPHRIGLVCMCFLHHPAVHGEWRSLGSTRTCCRIFRKEGPTALKKFRFTIKTSKVWFVGLLDSPCVFPTQEHALKALDAPKSKSPTKKSYGKHLKRKKRNSRKPVKHTRKEKATAAAAQVSTEEPQQSLQSAETKINIDPVIVKGLLTCLQGRVERRLSHFKT